VPEDRVEGNFFDASSKETISNGIASPECVRVTREKTGFHDPESGIEKKKSHSLSASVVYILVCVFVKEISGEKAEDERKDTGMT
jgi:hypothetical protein